MKKLIIISDWASDTLTCQEIQSVVEGFVKGENTPHITFVSSLPSTFHTGFLLSQVVETEERYGRPANTIIFQNTDLRTHTEDKLEAAEGAEFVVIKLVSGIYLCGPNAGYDFSFIKRKIDEMYLYKGFAVGGQFRSRDLYARVCAHLIEGMEQEFDLEGVHVNSIPEVRGFHVAHIDNYGNIKTTITMEDFKGNYEYGGYVPVSINGFVHKARYVKTIFSEVAGTLVVAKGSSGHKDNPYLELSVRMKENGHQKSAASLFHHPFPGDLIEIKI
ncbi:MAG TPA: SAM hydroxide adenosyltransferase [Patescibacteria group bacterium]|nr:SAM hydroxide adenosyltransferase [Patescibacteria group bacterium]